MSWPGIEITIDRTNHLVHTYAMDQRETEAIPINSSHGIHDIGTDINLWDGYWHNILYTWAMDDIISLTAAGPAGTAVLQKGVLVID